MISSRLDRRTLEAALGTKESEALLWWDAFTGSHPRVLDESDGYVDDPTILTIDVSRDVRVEIEYQPGGTSYRIVSADSTELLGEIGPHWRLPGLQWSELVAISNASERTGSILESQCFLVLLPLVWPESTTDIASQERAVATAIEQAGIATLAGATALAAAWADDIAAVAGVTWSRGPAGARSENGEGTRGVDLQDGSVSRLNGLIAEATTEP